MQIIKNTYIDERGGMKTKTCGALGVATLILTACGGGGGGGAAPSVVRPTPPVVRPTPPTTMSGIVTPPVTVGNGAATASATIRTPPNSTGTWNSVVQSMDYSFDPAAAVAVPALLKASSVNIRPVDTTTGFFSVTTGAANPADPATGQTLSITNILGGVAALFSTATGSIASQSTFAGLPAVVLVNNTTVSASGYVLPYSASLNPAGYAYQTFGAWSVMGPMGVVYENYFSAGVTPGAVPVAGTASYTGKAAGSGVDAATRDPYDTSATMNATANFATRSIAFATTGTTSLSNNAALGTLSSANPGLDMSGTLNYGAGGNTFTGAVSTVNGMSGNATGRFYGPGILAPTANQVLGSPPEIGGTFAVMNPGVGAMHGAFGGSGSHPPTVVLSIVGTVNSPLSVTNGLSTSPTNIMTATNSTESWSAVVQSMDYTYDPYAAVAVPAVQKAWALNIKPVDTATGSFSVTTGAAYPTYSALGQTTSVTNTVGGSSFLIRTGAPVQISTKLGGLQTVTLIDNPAGLASNYALPYSPTLNLAGYFYQTFGVWQSKSLVSGLLSENYFSAGVVSVPGTLPVLGTASYTGVAAGSYVNAVTNDPSKTAATMSATTDFAARTVAFSTTGTTSLSDNAAAGMLPTADAGLNMNGTLSYAAGANTFTGAVTTANGMIGNATGRFYGPGIATATANQILGSPPEIGGTFAVAKSNVGAMQGAFGGSGSHPPTIVPYITSILGTVLPPVTPTTGISRGVSRMLTAPNSVGNWTAITQSMDYKFDLVAAAATPSIQKLSGLNVKAVDTQTNSMLYVLTGAAYPTDATLGQTTTIMNSIGANGNTLSTITGAVASQTSLGGLAAVTLTNTGTSSSYVLPYSVTLNPAGYIYQTFGVWKTTSGLTNTTTENYFSSGEVALPSTLPVAGTASYTGSAAGTYVDAVSNAPSAISAAMNATANFATRSVAFATTGTTSLSANAAPGALTSANPGLDMSGTLNYALGSNTFTGAVSTVNGMTGNATGRFYGLGIISPTANQVLGSPPEIGGTFAVLTAGVGAMQGAFGGSGSHPPVIVPIPTAITGSVVPLSPFSGVAYLAANMLTAPNAIAQQWSSFTQSMDYTFDPAAAAAIPSSQKVTVLSVNPVDTMLGSLTMSTGAAYPLDPALGVVSSLSISAGLLTYTWSTASGNVVTQSTLAGMPAATFTNAATASAISYVLPSSATINPAGYTYQTFGSWTSAVAATNVSREYYFSAGAATVPATLPVLGTATYTGMAAGSHVDAITNDPSKTAATMNATADFAARTVAFSTTGTTILSNNAVAGTLPTANAALNMNGTLSYAAGNNTFTGAVTTTNGMSGNATGRFYGPGIVAATPTKAVGAPPEIGGTFAVMATSVGAMQGAFGGK